MAKVSSRCEWCGKTDHEMPDYPAQTVRFWLTDPFHKRDPKFFACSDACKSESEKYYADYFASVKKFGWGMAIIFLSTFGASIPFGYPVARWSLPAAIGLGGIWLFLFPFANSFRRHTDGSLKISLKRSLRDGRLAGVFFLAVAFIFLSINFWLPPEFPTY